MLLRVLPSLSSSSSMHSTDGSGESTLTPPEDSAYLRFSVIVAGKSPAGCHWFAASWPSFSA
jgi:hypothetical protein